MQPADDPAKLAQQKAQLDKENAERTRLLEELRNLMVRNPKINISVDDILTDEIKKFTNEELKNALRNIQFTKLQKSSLLNAKGFLTGMNTVVETVSLDELTIQTAIEDQELQKDVEELVHDYFGDVPVLGRILVKIGSHVQVKKKEEPKANDK